MWGKRYKGLIWVVAALILIFSIRNVYAAEEEKIKLKVEAGIDSVYKIGNNVPVNIEIENNLKDINGELQVEVETSQMDQQNNVTIYAQNINISNNSSKNITLNVPIMKYLTKLKVNIVDGKNTVYEKTFSIPGGVNYEGVIIGILSDNYDSVSYMNSIKFPINRNSTIKNVKLNEKNLPDDSSVLNNLNVIIINDFDTSKLSENQYEAIKKWINEGGMLVIGTGPSYNKTLSLFKKDNFISGEIGNVEDVVTRALFEVVEDYNSRAVTLSAVSMDIKGSTQPIKEGKFPLLHRIDKGSGVVAIAAFDFGINPIANWSQKGIFTSRLLGMLLPSSYASDYNMKMSAMARDPYLITNTLKNIADLPIPKTKYLAIIFLIYIILAAPINYLILKKLDRREWMWVSVPALSIVFGIFMYIFGFSTRISEPIANIFTSISIDKNGAAIPKTYASIMTPSKKDVRVETEDGSKITMLPIANYDYMSSTSNSKAPKTINAKVMMGAKNSIEFYQNSIFSSKSIELENTSLQVGKLDCNINYSNGVFTGEINNISGYDLEEAYIITSDNYIVVGPLKSGEKKTINEKGDYYNGNIYELTNKIWKNPLNVPNPKTNLSDEEIVQLRKDEQKRSAINLVFQGDYMKVKDPKLVGFASKSQTKDLLVNGKAIKKYEKTVISSEVKLTFRKGNQVEYPLGYIKPQVSANNMKGGYDEMGMMFYGSGAFEVVYQIDSSINVEKIESSFKYRGAAASGDFKTYIWNYKTGSYEEEAITAGTFEKEKLEKYLNKTNVLKFKVEINNMDGNAEVPRISVKGSVK